MAHLTCISGKRILLTGVFGPFGVDDEFGRKENIMELFHNQVTREQGVASFRFLHRSFGLYFLAENIEGDVTVLDFPSRRAFQREVDKGYDVVGISFIAPNFRKAQDMAQYVRQVSPGTTIVLGGHGTAVEGVEDQIPCDHVVRGEGVRPLRRILGQNPDAPIRHPVLPSSEKTMLFGIPVPGQSANVLVPGVGCVNACKFCCTSHFFGKEYTSYLSTGKDLFDTACAVADQRGGNAEFFVLDENFLKDRDRALDLLGRMEREHRYFEFNVFSSAEAIQAFGVDNLMRLGARFVWIGVESSTSQGNYAKNDGVDPAVLIRQLQERGIAVLASAIVCMEHHTPENIQQDIDYMANLHADFVQFMLLTPLPVTALYRDHQKRGLLREDLPLEEWHGQKELSFRHPAFPGDEAARWLKRAFRHDYEVNGSSMLRILRTSVRGALWLAKNAGGDPCLECHRRRMEERVQAWRPSLSSILAYPVNQAETRAAKELRRQIDSHWPATLQDRATGIAARTLTHLWDLRCRIRGDRIQPRSLHTRYVAGVRTGVQVSPVRHQSGVVASRGVLAG
jgi:hypothetical protein